MLKHFSLIILGIISACVIAITTAYLVIDDATLAGWAKKRLAGASGIEVSSQSAMRLTRTLSPTLSVRGLVIHDPQKGFRVETSQLVVQISLPALVLGKLDIRQLHIGATHVTTAKTDAETDRTDLITLLRKIDALPLQPVLHDLQIDQITLLREGHEERLPELQIDAVDLRYAANEDLILALSGLGLADHLLDLQVEFPPLRRIVQDGKVPFTLSVQYETIEAEAKGLLDLTREPATLSASLRIASQDLDRLSTGIEGLVIPGRLTATARLSGTGARLSLQDIAASWQGPEQSNIRLEGSLGNILELEQAALKLEAKLNKPDWFLSLLPEDMQNTQTIESTSRISGSVETLVFEDLKLRTLSTEGLAEHLTGKMKLVHVTTKPAIVDMDQEFQFSAPTTIAARPLLFPGVPEFGRISGRARVHSTRGHPSLQDIEVKTEDKKGIRVALTGNIASFPLDSTPNDGYDLKVHIAADHTQVIAKRVGLDLPVTDPLAVDFRIEGATSSLRLEKITLTAGSKQKVHLQATGHVHFASWDRADPITDMNLDLRLRSRDTPLLAKLLHQPRLPELGPLLAKAQIRSQSGKHRIDNIHVSTTSGAPLSAVVTGSAAKLVVLPKFQIDGIRLQANANAQDTSVLQSVLKTDQRIPAIGPLQASLSITGSSMALSLDKLSVKAGRQPVLRVQARGTLGRIAAADDWRLKGTDIMVNAGAPGSQALAEKLGYQIPELGRVSARATMNDKDKTLGIESASLTVGDSNHPVIRVLGGIDSFLDPGTSHWNVDLDISGQDLAAMTSDATLPDLGDLRGRAIISDSDGSLGIDSLEISSTKPGLLTIDIDGNFKDFRNPDTLSFDGKITARDLNLLGSLMGLDLLPIGPVKWDTQIGHRKKNLVFTSLLTADDSRIDADIVAVLTATPPRLKGSIKADKMIIGGYVDRLAARKKKISKKKEKATGASNNGPIFSRTPLNIGWMRKVDLDIDIDVASFNRKYALADSGRARVALKAGKLSIHPFRLDYGRRSLDLDLQMDINDRPNLTLKASAKDLNLWQHLDLKPGKRGVYPSMDVDIDINTSGNSKHELVSRAKGKLFASVVDGKMQRNMLNLLFVDVIGWATTRVSSDKYEKINCGVADFTIDDGILTTRAFLIDTDDITITGEGTIDLGKETIDYVMLPKKKSRIIAKAEPVKITGQLDDPSISALPLKSAAANYGSLIFGPVVFAGVFVSQEILGKLNQIRTSGEQSDCDKYKEAYEARLGSDDDPAPNASPPNAQPRTQ